MVVRRNIHMMRLALASFAFILLLAPHGASAFAETSASASPAAHCGRDLNFLLGIWDVSAREPGAEKADRFDYEVRPLVGTAWISGHAKSVELGAESADVWGRDASTGDIIRVIFDKSGTYALVRSAGWQNGRLILEGDALSANGSIRVKETISCINQNEFNARWEALRNGVWSPYSDEHAVRRRS
jgi:hypothetical protein